MTTRKRFTVRRVADNPWYATAYVVDRVTGMVEGPYSPEASARRLANDYNELVAAGVEPFDPNASPFRAL